MGCIWTYCVSCSDITDATLANNLSKALLGSIDPTCHNITFRASQLEGGGLSRLLRCITIFTVFLTRDCLSQTVQTAIL